MNDEKFVRFSAEVVFRGLERPHLFHVRRDELYELDAEGLAFVAEVDGRRRGKEVRNRKLLSYADSEGLLEYSETPSPRSLSTIPSSPSPSLRYLELLLTFRCNLRCRHCYLGEPQTVDLAPEYLDLLLPEFDEMQGLRLLLSGGEPLLYPHWSKLASLLPGRGFRIVLLTNGRQLEASLLADLPVHEVQVSLDGLTHGHEAMRGAGSFLRALAAARLVKECGKDLSIATMVHPGNLAELAGLSEVVRELGAREWSLEAPAPIGRWTENAGLPADDERLSQLLSLGFGGSYHGGAEGTACGRHLAAVLPDGRVCSCGFYADQPLGHLAEGLREVWSRKKVALLSELEWCRDCPAVQECGGGCRYRAVPGGPDPLACVRFGWPKGKPRR